MRSSWNQRRAMPVVTITTFQRGRLGRRLALAVHHAHPQRLPQDRLGDRADRERLARAGAGHDAEPLARRRPSARSSSPCSRSSSVSRRRPSASSIVSHAARVGRDDDHPAVGVRRPAIGVGIGREEMISCGYHGWEGNPRVRGAASGAGGPPAGHRSGAAAQPTGEYADFAGLAVACRPPMGKIAWRLSQTASSVESVAPFSRTRQASGVEQPPIVPIVRRFRPIWAWFADLRWGSSPGAEPIGVIGAIGGSFLPAATTIQSRATTDCTDCTDCTPIPPYLGVVCRPSMGKLTWRRANRCNRCNRWFLSGPDANGAPAASAGDPSPTRTAIPIPPNK